MANVGLMACDAGTQTGSEDRGIKSFLRRVIFLAFMVAVLAPSPADAESESEREGYVLRNIPDLSSADSDRRFSAAENLKNFASDQHFCHALMKAVPALLTALKDRDANVRIRVALAVISIDSAQPPAIRVLLAALTDNDAKIRESGVNALSLSSNCAEYASKGLGKQRELVVPALAAAMRDDESEVRGAAVGALRSYGHDAGIALPTLIELLGNEDGYVRADAARVIAVIGPDAPPAINPLTAMLRDKNVYARVEAAAALAEIGANLSQAVPVVTRLLSHEDPSISTRAAFVLGQFGAAAEPAIPRLTATLSDGGNMAGLAIASLKKIVQALLEAHRTDAIKVLRAAATTMEHFVEGGVVDLRLDISEAVEALEALQARSSR